MNFKIPTLDEARKTHENTSAEIRKVKIPSISRSNGNDPSFKSSMNNASSTSSSSSSRSILGSSSTIPVTMHSPSPKTKNTNGQHFGINGKISTQQNASKKVIVNPYLKYKKKKQEPKNENVSIKNPQERGLSTHNSSQPTSVLNTNASTFSQAFQNSTKSTTNLQSSVQGDESNDSEQHRALEASILISQLSEREGDKSSADRDRNSARDNHALLQPHILHVSTKQRGNRILQHIRNVPFELSKMIPDYIMGPNRCALFLSCKYHKLHPTYIHRRIAELGTDFELRVLLTLVDMEDNASTLLFLNHLSVLNNLSLILAWSEEEAARYLETFKAYEKKDATLIQKREKETYSEQVADVLATVRSINKTDSQQLLAQFGSFRSIITSNMDELSLCPGIGPKKVKRLHDAFHKPFSSGSVAKRKKVEKAKEEKNVKDANPDLK